MCSPYTSVEITGMCAPSSFSRQNPISVQITGYLSATNPKSASHCSSHGCSRFIGYGCETYATFSRSIGATATGVRSYAQLKPAQRHTALGLYVAHINGQRVGDAYLTPGWTSYQKMLQYQEYDITSMMEECNVLEIAVGNGMRFHKNRHEKYETQELMIKSKLCQEECYKD